MDKMKRLAFLVMMILATGSLYAQRKIEGTVTDAKSNETLIGVTVHIKGTSSGTTTDINGKYWLVSDQLTASSVIVYSYIGFTSVEQI
ncbi:MAG: carboxypeptidase-like regulatory domain-containing protein, partial [Bacteroidales bacterium]|nr:carboxypeptidase-like regulatory domain-containing protein [Bacteroidales bacterium]